MIEHVQYIEKTSVYYRNEGYSRDYAWADHDECAFTPLSKPLSDSRIGLVTTASMVTLSETGEPLETARIMGSNKLEVSSLPSKWPPERLRSTSEDHDRFQTDMTDLGAYLPKEHLRDLAKGDEIGSFADEIWRILPNYSKRKVSAVDAPEVLGRAKAQGVDAMVLAPV